jgi:hypothetical protein
MRGEKREKDNAERQRPQRKRGECLEVGIVDVWGKTLRAEKMAEQPVMRCSATPSNFEENYSLRWKVTVTFNCTETG